MTFKSWSDFTVFFSMLMLLGVFLSCKNDKPAPKGEVAPSLTIKDTSQPVESKSVENSPADTIPANLHYAFLKNKEVPRLHQRIPSPSGFERITVTDQSFAQWLRYLPTKMPSGPVRLYNGELKSNQNAHEAIIDIDVGKRDLQQCADAVMRLKSEFHYSKKEYESIHFNFTSGHKVAFEDWAKGRKPQVSGNSVRFSAMEDGSPDFSYPNFKKYLTMIFNYAGTASLSKELKTVPLKNMEIGDVFIQGGFPGHAVLVMDMVENEQGEKLFLLAQSYMPAQDMHILKNYNEPDLSPWYRLDFENQLDTPEWTFYQNDLKRF